MLTVPFPHEVSPEFVEFAKRVPRPVICEIGSRDAFDALFLYKALGAVECHIFEPNPPAAENCKNNIARYGKGYAVHFNQIGVSDKAGAADFFPINPDKSERGDIGLSSLFQVNPRYSSRRGAVVQDKVTIATTTLDSYFSGDKEKPDILWVDVEGAELMVFKGGEHTLDHVKLIHVEISFRPMHVGKPLFHEVDEYLKERGFKFHKFIGVPKWKEFLAVHGLLPRPPWRWNAVYYR